MFFVRRAVASVVEQHNNIAEKNGDYVTVVKRVGSSESNNLGGESLPSGAAVQPGKPSLGQSREGLSEGDAGAERTVGG